MAVWKLLVTLTLNKFLTEVGQQPDRSRFKGCCMLAGGTWKRLIPTNQ